MRRNLDSARLGLLHCAFTLGFSPTVFGQLVVRDGVDFDANALNQLSAAASLQVNVGTFDLLPNTADQVIEISVTGGLDIAGINFYGLIEDGFPDITGSVSNGPNITDVDLIGDADNPTIFFPSNTGQSGIDQSRPQAFFRTLTVGVDGEGASIPVSGSGVFARLTVDTTGFTSGSYSLSFSGKDDIDPAYPSLQFLDVNAQTITTDIIDGTLTIVPEPHQMALVTGFALLGLTSWRKLRAQTAEPSTE